MRTFLVTDRGQDYKLDASTPFEAVQKATQSIPDLVVHSGTAEQPQHGCSIWRFTVATPDEGWAVWVRERYSWSNLIQTLEGNER